MEIQDASICAMVKTLVMLGQSLVTTIMWVWVKQMETANIQQLMWIDFSQTKTQIESTAYCWIYFWIFWDTVTTCIDSCTTRVARQREGCPFGESTDAG